MASDGSPYHRYYVAAFWLGIGAIAIGIVGMVTFNPLLFQLYLVTTVFVVGALAAIRWRAGKAFNSGWAYGGLAAPLGFLALSLFLFVPLCGLRHRADRFSESCRSLKRIALGLHDYHAKHDRLPAAAITDAQGVPLLSWRVAILPFIGEEELYRKFDLEQAWDSPWNERWLKHMPAVYRAPAMPGDETPPHWTFYQALVGPGTAFEPGIKLNFQRDFPDGITDTIIVVEGGNPVPWTKPEDVIYDPKGPLPELGGVFSGKGRFPWNNDSRNKRMFVALCDSSTRYVLLNSISERTLRAVITRNDGVEPGNDW